MAAKKQIVIKEKRKRTSKKFQMAYITQKERHPTLQILAKLINLESCLTVNTADLMIVLKDCAEKNFRKGEVDSVMNKQR
jgi:hypothetical protein